MFILPASLWANSEATTLPNKEHSQWLKQMKESSQGPFKNVKWFCHDGTILPPKAYACKKHGGGVQHGNYTKQTKT